MIRAAGLVLAAAVAVNIRRAYAIREKTYGKESTETASLLISIGNVYHAQKDYPAALDAYRQALDVLERTAGPYHNYTLMAINNAARTLAAEGNVPAALQQRSRFEALLDKAIEFNLAIGSDREKLAYLEQTFERMGRTISLHLRQAPDNPEAADLAAITILRRKGRVRDASLDSRAALRAHLQSGDRRILDELSSRHDRALDSGARRAGPHAGGAIPAAADDARAAPRNPRIRRQPAQRRVSRGNAGDDSGRSPCSVAGRRRAG
jgi:tetratricopeptide (TPR) repeat protein